MHARFRGSNNLSILQQIINEKTKPRPDMNIQVTA